MEGQQIPLSSTDSCTFVIPCSEDNGWQDLEIRARVLACRSLASDHPIPATFNPTPDRLAIRQPNKEKHSMRSRRIGQGEIDAQ
jgi:hypothetical protein